MISPSADLLELWQMQNLNKSSFSKCNLIVQQKANCVIVVLDLMYEKCKKKCNKQDEKVKRLIEDQVSAQRGLEVHLSK